ncbi:MAG TPA: hypothetical protein VLM80_03750 [Anaerolineales bacterium]|nr:hypothetical protein [Anaerolineales bacterium]
MTTNRRQPDNAERTTAKASNVEFTRATEIHLSGGFYVKIYDLLIT